jgi:shikimate dehydrogenase
LCTSPHKAALSRHLHACSDRSALLGMVNVVRKEGGRLVGDILDGDGVVGALGARGVPVADTEVAIVGCGGLGSAAAYALLVAGARCLHLVDTAGRRAEALAAALGQRFGRGRTLHARQAPADVGIVINASPVGMNGGDISPMPLPPEPCWLAVVDAAGSACAPLQVFARRHGITLVDGDEIARAQMPLLLDFWTFDKPEDASS